VLPTDSGALLTTAATPNWFRV